MTEKTDSTKTAINVSSEYGRLNAVLLHRPGIEIERMTPENANEALYSDILSKHIVDREYASFCGVFEKWTKVYYVEDILRDLMDNDDVRQLIVSKSCKLDGCEHIIDELMRHPSQQQLIRHGKYKSAGEMFVRSSASPENRLQNEVLINSMSFRVRQRETLIYKSIFEDYFRTKTFCAMDHNRNARTEGGDVHIASPDLLCIGMGIRTNYKGIKYLADKFGQEREHFRILVQELPHKPDSFIHLDMVFTFLGSHQCMAYQPMLDKTGNFADKSTTLIEMDHGKMKVTECANLLEGLKACGMEMEPVYCGGPDSWYQDREQWHSGANFFALGDGKVIGYERNVNTIESLNKAGFSVLDADDVCSGKTDLYDYDKFVVTFKASELPRAGGGARCMTMPLNRD